LGGFDGGGEGDIGGWIVHVGIVDRAAAAWLFDRTDRMGLRDEGGGVRMLDQWSSLNQL